MNLSQRGTGNTNILKEIREASKKISVETGLAESMRIFPEQPKIDESKLGAAASLGLNKKASIPQEQQDMLQIMFGSSRSGSVNESSNERQVSGQVGSSGSIKFDFTKSSIDRLVDNIEMLNTTKEYFNALQSMLSLYALGYLDNNVLDKLSREDLKELKGILREFKSIIDEY